MKPKKRYVRRTPEQIAERRHARRMMQGMHFRYYADYSSYTVCGLKAGHGSDSSSHDLSWERTTTNTKKIECPACLHLVMRFVEEARDKALKARGVALKDVLNFAKARRITHGLMAATGDGD